MDHRHATVDRDHVHYDGNVRVEALVRMVDGIDLDHALAHGAEARKALGSTASLDVRRSEALGDLARLQTSLDLAGVTGAARVEATGSPARTAQEPEGGNTGGNAGVTLPPARQFVLHAHFDVTATEDGSIVFGPTGRLEEGQRLVLLDQVEAWCGDSGTTVVVKPVVDLNAHLDTDAYAVPDRLREQVVLRAGTCVFPWCSRPARRCQVDHVIPHDPTAAAEGRPQPGPTASGNLAPLCIRHHRLKTHGRWRYRATGPGRFEWTSPHGYTYRRDPTGTTALDPPPPRVPHPRRR